MSEVTRWTIIAIISAAVLSWGFVTWRNRQRRGQANPANDSTPTNSFWQAHPLLLSVIALGFAGLAQYALRINQPGAAALGYGLAVILFISALRPLVPVSLIAETPAPPAEPKTKPPPPEPKPRPTLSIPTLSKLAFLQTWRYYTLADLLKGRAPTLPSPPEVEPPLQLQPDPLPTTEPIWVSEPAPVTTPEIVSTSESQTVIAVDTLPVNQATLSTEAVGEATPAPTNTGSTPKPAPVAVWSGFNQPDSILLTAHGQILVMDVAQQIIYRLNPNGQIVQQWSVPPLPEPNGRNLALSPDGHHLYLTDARKGLVYAITLED